MLDNLRESASQSPFFQDETPVVEEQQVEVKRRKRSSGTFLGLTTMQRFVLALLLFLMTCVLSSFFLLAFEKIWPFAM